MNDYFVNHLLSESIWFLTRFQCTAVLVLVEKLRKIRDLRGVFAAVPTDSSKEDSNSNYYLIKLFCVIPAVFCTYYIWNILLVFSCISGYGSFISATLLQQFTHPRWFFCKSGLYGGGKFYNKGL